MAVRADSSTFAQAKRPMTVTMEKIMFSAIITAPRIEDEKMCDQGEPAENCSAAMKRTATTMAATTANMIVRYLESKSPIYDGICMYSKRCSASKSGGTHKTHSMVRYCSQKSNGIPPFQQCSLGTTFA
jgi:hypothetical protein